MSILLIDHKEILYKKMNLIQLNNREQLCIVGPVRLPINRDGLQTTFQWYTWLKVDQQITTKDQVLEYILQANLHEKQQSSVLVYGDFANENHALIRMHSICHTGDIFGSERCDCGYQLTNR